MKGLVGPRNKFSAEERRGENTDDGAARQEEKRKAKEEVYGFGEREEDAEDRRKGE